MNNFNIIYRILKALERAMDLERFDTNEISNEKFGISEVRWIRLIQMLVDEGYVEGVRIIKPDGAPLPIVMVDKIHITLKGLEYLNDNSMMKKAGEAVKGVIDVIK